MVGSDVRTARLAAVRARADGRRAPVPLADSVALAGVGFETLSEVVGAVALLDAQGGFFASGWNAADVERPRTFTTSPPNQRVGVPTTLTTQKTGFARAFARLVEEAQALGADGVVGIRVDSAYRGTDTTRLYETVVQGTAVRAVRAARGTTAVRPFTTSMTGSQTAVCLRAGLVPVTYLQTPVMGVRYVDPASAKQLARRSANGEVAELTELLSVCRDRARADFSAAARRSGADSAVIDDLHSELHVHSSVAGLHTASATVTGTALAHFRPPDGRAPGPTVAVVPLAELTTRKVRR